ncbi:MAG: hypothetical protein HYX78_11165 [Armatimonadetes bacterium]|nr:hypothetical protein [Armatimonadota bacterium]
MQPVPLIHITDLFMPPGDPDDHIDLATVYALPEFDVRAVVLDYSGGWEGCYPIEPAFIPVVQLNYLTGRAVPVAVGPISPLTSPDDTCTDRPLREQAGIELITRVLRESPSPAYVSVVGSTRALTAAINRDPELARKKIRAVLLSAGATGDFKECNVEMDPAAFVGLFRSGVKIHWFPCATEKGPFDTGEHNTFWCASHAQLFKDLPRPLRAWFTHSYTGNLRGDILRALDEQGMWPPWDNIFTVPVRNMWSTAMFVLAAGRVLVKVEAAWRFVSAESAPEDAPRQCLELEPVEVTVTDNAVTHWTPAGGGEPNVLLFRRNPGTEHTSAMAEALNSLLCSMPLDR